MGGEGLPRKQLTLLMLTCHRRILLGMKKRGFGVGKYNGFGGKVEPGESLVAAAVRETVEEAGVTPLAPRLVGNLLFTFVGSPEALEVHVFRALDYAGGPPTESDEMAPRWFALDTPPAGPAAAATAGQDGVDEHGPPYERMWLDDKHWLPLLLAGSCFSGKFVFDGHDTMVSHSLRVVEAHELPHAPGAVLVTGAPQGPILA